MLRSLLLVLVTYGASASATGLPHTVWLEAETFGPLHGGNFSYQRADQTTKGSWSVAGPGVAAEWTQGGESEWMSIAARADEPGEVVCGRDAEIPAAGRYMLWVRYADYRNKKESFGVRIKQGEQAFTHLFGERAIIDELDPMKLLWDWSFAWDHVPVDLQKGTARIELHTTGPTEARRQIDCVCLTTDAKYRPAGREKPDCAAWIPLRQARDARMPRVEPLIKSVGADVPAQWTISDDPPAFLWNASDTWYDELARPAAERVEWPFTADPPIEKDFLKELRGKSLAVYGDPLSGPAPHVSKYGTWLASGSRLLEWLARHPDRKFGIVLNYGEPTWPAGADKRAVYETLKAQKDRFLGFVAGESISYDSPDGQELEKKVKAAKSRLDVLNALHEVHDAATAKKYSAYFGGDLAPAEAWAKDIPCLSGNMESLAHALAAWGVKRIGHENTGNSPTLARRLAFLRGAARQFGVKLCDYQSCNLGDASGIFSRQASFWPGSSRYILDNSYDVWAGAGVNWVLKDYVLFWLAGCDAFYHEEGNDIYWKAGGNAAGDNFPVELSPRGRVTEAFMSIASKHRPGSQITPIAFLLDEAHGWSQERFAPGAFALDRELNPKLLYPGRHEASIRGWFDIAYYPAPETQNEPASAIRQTYVNGIFGDIFDVIVTAPGRTAIAKTYPVVIAAGEVPLSEEWGKALLEYVRSGGTLVVCVDQLSGPGATAMGLDAPGPESEADSFRWKMSGQELASNVYRYRALPAEGATVLAQSPDGKPIATLRRQGNGQVIEVGVPLGLGIDERPVPILSLLLRHLAEGAVPLKVAGDVEWSISRTRSGYLISLLNNRGVIKPQHGVLPTDHREAQEVTLTLKSPVRKSTEWVTSSAIEWHGSPDGATTTVSLPAGAVRLIEAETDR